MAKSKGRSKGTAGRNIGCRLYELDVALTTGPVSKKYIKANPVVARVIQIRGDQTLMDLHEAIFDAFDREEEHMFEFQVGGKGPMDRKARRYVLPMAMDDEFGPVKPAGDVTLTSIESLGLKFEEAFGYWFDFGDDWWHQVNVLAIHDEVPPGKYPRVIQKTGESPPQYMDWDEDENMEEEEEG